MTNSNSPQSFQHFRLTLRRNFNWIRQQMKDFSTDPHCKMCPQAVFTMGVYEEILYPLSDLTEIGTRARLKPSNDRGEFKLDRARSKNNIA